MRTDFQTRLDELNAELEAYKAAEDARGLARLNASEANAAMFLTFFQSKGITFGLRNISRDTYYGDRNNFRYTLTLTVNENDSWGQSLEFVVADDAIKVSRFDVSQRQGKEIDLNQSINFHNNMISLCEVLKGTELVELVGNWHTTDYELPTRTDYQIRQDIDQLKEMSRVDEMPFHVGGNLIIDVNGPRTRYGHQWENCTITKINKKTVQFVINYKKDDGTVRQSSVQGVPFDYRYFRSLNQHEAILAEKARVEAERRAKRGW